MKKLTLIFLAIFGFSFLSCQKEMFPVEHPSIKATAVELPELVKSAKQYYDQELKDHMATEFSNKAKERRLASKEASTASASSQEPMAWIFWKRAHTSERNGREQVEVPIRFSHRIVSRISMSRYNDGGRAGRPMVRTIFDRLLLSQQKGGKSFKTAVMRYHPDKAYLEKHGDNVQHVYLHNLQDFTGYLELITVDGVRKAIYRIEDGKSVKRHVYRPEASRQKQANGKEMPTESL